MVLIGSGVGIGNVVVIGNECSIRNKCCSKKLQLSVGIRVLEWKIML